jgi:Zn finger protein HypA/HybF involved in hydrogenase expression
MKKDKKVGVNVYFMKQVKCRDCGLYPFETDGINLVATETQYTLLCPECYKKYGLEQEGEE